MAVVRIKADRRWLRRAAEHAQDPKVERELRRATGRRSLMAEFTVREVVQLNEDFPGQVRLQEAAERGRTLERVEADALRRRRAMADRIRGLSDG